MRGSLIFAFEAELFRLDARGPPGTPAMDDDFKEAIRSDVDDDGIGEPARGELPPVRIPCQVEPASLEEERMFPAGSSPRLTLSLVFHFKDLERLGLVDAATGEALVRHGDRLGGIYDKAGRLVQAVRTPPGMYARATRPLGFGLGRHRPTRNLLLVTFEERRTATQREI